MTEHKHEDYRLVCVVWRDSESKGGWTDVRDLDGKLRPIVTVGFLVHEGDATISVTLSIGGWNLCQDPITIPWEAVVYMDDVSFDDAKVRAQVEAGR